VIRVYRRRYPGSSRSARYHFYFVLDGQRFRGATPFTTRRPAEEFARQRYDEARERLLGPDSSKPVRFADFVRTCLERLRSDVSPAWDGVQRDYLRAHFLPFFGEERLLHTIRPVDLERYKQERLGVGARPVTVNKELAVLSKIFREAVEWGRLRVSPFLGVHRVPLDRDPETRALLSEEAARLLDAAREDPFGAFLWIGLHTGMRPSEILGLRWEDVDFRKNSIAVVHREDRSVKTRRTRYVAVHPDLRAYLLGLPRPMDRSGYLFPGEKGPHRSRYIRRSFDRIAERAGLEGVTPYMLRHTAATMLAAAGCSLAQLKAILGHRTFESTQRYIHLTHEDLTGAVERIKFSTFLPREAESGGSE